MNTRSLDRPPELIKLLANELRWNLLKALSISDYRVHELVAHVEQPFNLVSYHLKRLRHDGLVFSRRSDADRRDIYYTLNLTALRQMYLSAGRELHPFLSSASIEPPQLQPGMRVLFVCTHNSARSQMAEGLLRQMSRGQIEVESGGSEPGKVNPFAIQALETMQIDIRAHWSKHINLLANQHFDYVITVCDQAREICPSFIADGAKLHWSIADPSLAAESDRLEAFIRTAHELQQRIGYLLMFIHAQQGAAN